MGVQTWTTTWSTVVQDINTLLGIGGLQQQQAQKEFDVERANELARQSLPYQQVGFMSDIFRGVPALQQTIQQQVDLAQVQDHSYLV